MYRKNENRRYKNHLINYLRTIVLTALIMLALSLSQPEATNIITVPEIKSVPEIRTIIVKMEVPHHLPENENSSNMKAVPITAFSISSQVLEQKDTELKPEQEQKPEQEPELKPEPEQETKKEPEQEQEQRQEPEHNQGSESENRVEQIVEIIEGRFLINHYDIGRSEFIFKDNRVKHTFRGKQSFTKTGEYLLHAVYKFDWSNKTGIDGQYVPELLTSSVELEERLKIIEFYWSDGTIDYAEYDKGGFIAPSEAIWWRNFPHIKRNNQ